MGKRKDGEGSWGTKTVKGITTHLRCYSNKVTKW